MERSGTAGSAAGPGVPKPCAADPLAGKRTCICFPIRESETSRVRGTVKFSSDGTDTWTSKRLLEPGEFGYSCMTQLPDGQIGILYEGSDITQYFAKFPVEWVLGASPE